MERLFVAINKMKAAIDKIKLNITIHNDELCRILYGNHLYIGHADMVRCGEIMEH